MSKKTLSIVVILTFFFPFLLWNFVNCVEGVYSDDGIVQENAVSIRSGV